VHVADSGTFDFERLQSESAFLNRIPVCPSPRHLCTVKSQAICRPSLQAPLSLRILLSHANSSKHRKLSYLQVLIYSNPQISDLTPHSPRCYPSSLDASPSLPVPRLRHIRAFRRPLPPLSATRGSRTPGFTLAHQERLRTSTAMLVPRLPLRPGGSYPRPSLPRRAGQRVGIF